MPIMLIGLHVRPTGRDTPWMTTPNRPNSAVTGLELADCTLLQHCIGPVLHCDGAIGVGVGPGVTVTV